MTQVISLGKGWRWREGEYEVIRTSGCGGGGNTGNCGDGCGLLLYVKDGRLVKVEGDREHPYNMGRLCIRGLSAKQIVHHPDRLLYPMKRVGERGEGKWQRITWEEAYDIIVNKLKEIIDKYGPESIVFHAGTGRGSPPWFTKLLFNLGSPNWTTPGHECGFVRHMTSGLTFGVRYDLTLDFAQQFPERYKAPEWRKPECVMILGSNTIISNFSTVFGHWVVDLMRMGTKLIVVDPRLTWLASRAEYWLQLRPGTDAALLMGMLHIILKERLYDREFVEKWTNAPFLVRCDARTLLRGYEVTGKRILDFMVWDPIAREVRGWDIQELKYRIPDTKPALEGEYEVKLADGSLVKCKTVLQMLWERVKDYTPEKVSEITWVPKDKIVETTRFFAKNKPAGVHSGAGVDQSVSAFGALRALAIMMALTGNFDIPGGMIPERKPFGVVAFDQVWGFDDLPSTQVRKILDIGKRPLLATGKFFVMAHMWDVVEAILTGKPYPVKALVSIGGGDYLTSNENVRKTYEALKKVEFLVKLDLFPSPMTEMADIVLPVASWVERNNLKAWFTPIVTQNQALRISPEVKSDMEVTCELARRLIPDKWPWKTIEEVYTFCLKPTGLTFKEAQEKAPIYEPFTYKKYEKGLERPDGKPGFNTPTGKAEIWSFWLQQIPGIDPISIYYVEPPESPISTPWLLKEYPLILTTGGRSWEYFHAEGRQIPWMRELHPDPLVEMHPETAAELGIKEGDWVYVETRRGRCKMKATLSIGIHPKVVRAEHCWWYPEKLGKAPLLEVLEPNIQFVTDDVHADTAMGSSTNRAMLCRIYKAEGG